LNQLTLTEIRIYPIKSLGGISLDKAQIFGKGLAHDRRWMLIDENGLFMTQRTHPQMALFKLQMDKDKIYVTFKNGESDHPSTSFFLHTQTTGELIVPIWNDRVSVHEVDSAVSKWFAQHLGVACRLVNFPEGNPRPVDPAYKVNDEQVSLADAYPFMIIGQSSLDDLNTRLKEPVPMNRFRPNFVFSGGEPYEEDQWRNFRIGKNRFVAVKKCARCTIPTVNQDTGKTSKEPLRTLAAYRSENNNVFFGQNLVCLNEGEVAVDDTIELTK
jgi:uncharacterized protein YcbX